MELPAAEGAAVSPVREKTPPGIYIATKNDVTQTSFIEGHLGGILKDKDFPALEIMGDILGGGFQSRLVQRVRTQLGLAYDISADWGANYDHPGLFEIAGSTKSASTAETLEGHAGTGRADPHRSQVTAGRARNCTAIRAERSRLRL